LNAEAIFVLPTKDKVLSVADLGVLIWGCVHPNLIFVLITLRPGSLEQGGSDYAQIASLTSKECNGKAVSGNG
jgi:hypothetical protein